MTRLQSTRARSCEEGHANCVPLPAQRNASSSPRRRRSRQSDRRHYLLPPTSLIFFLCFLALALAQVRHLRYVFPCSAENQRAVFSTEYGCPFLHTGFFSWAFCFLFKSYSLLHVRQTRKDRPSPRNDILVFSSSYGCPFGHVSFLDS